jgi:hypothetical protein
MAQLQLQTCALPPSLLASSSCQQQNLLIMLMPLQVVIARSMQEATPEAFHTSAIVAHPVALQ